MIKVYDSTAAANLSLFTSYKSFILYQIAKLLIKLLTRVTLQPVVVIL